MEDPLSIYRDRYREFIESILQKGDRGISQGEMHHIIPRCCGGSDTNSNLLMLTYAEHYIAHLILAEENPTNRDLCVAIHKMIHDGKHPVTSPEDYEKVKVLFGKCQSEYMKQHSPWKRKTEKQLEMARRPKSCITRVRLSKSVKETWEHPTLSMINRKPTGFDSGRALEAIATLRASGELYKKKKCLVCETEFRPSSSTHKYCSYYCKEFGKYLRGLPYDTGIIRVVS